MLFEAPPRAAMIEPSGSFSLGSCAMASSNI
jgi:hypothetical protein